MSHTVLPEPCSTGGDGYKGLLWLRDGDTNLNSRWEECQGHNVRICGMNLAIASIFGKHIYHTNGRLCVSLYQS